jgi:hypothetical protein
MVIFGMTAFAVVISGIIILPAGTSLTRAVIAIQMFTDKTQAGFNHCIQHISSDG